MNTFLAQIGPVETAFGDLETRFGDLYSFLGVVIAVLIFAFLIKAAWDTVFGGQQGGQKKIVISFVGFLFILALFFKPSIIDGLLSIPEYVFSKFGDWFGGEE